MNGITLKKFQKPKKLIKPQKVETATLDLK